MMKNLTLLLLIFALFSCGEPKSTMESDADRICKIATDMLKQSSNTMSVDLGSIKDAMDNIAEMQDIQSKYKDDRKFLTYLLKNCDIGNSFM